jgi:hypothetical protein
VPILVPRLGSAARPYLEPKRRPRLRGAASVAAGILAVGVTVAACNSGPPRPGATAGSTTTVVRPLTGGSTQRAEQVAYSSCMRSHGVPNFPDPGGNQKRAVESALEAVSNSQAQAAQNTCGRLVPAGVWPGGAVQTITAQQQQDYLNAAACMRSHGITGFPDPTFPGGTVDLNIPSSIDQNSTQFIQAAQTCSKLIPTGLPYSNGTGG